jgi:hypothetical protein
MGQAPYNEAYKLKNIHRKIDLKNNYFPYIPICSYNLEYIVNDVLKSKKKLNKLSFIDIGAGTNTIPQLFKILGFGKVAGLEFDPVYVALDNQKLLLEGDLLTYNFKDYDILYSYNPIIDSNLMIKGITNIITTMKKGAILYFVPCHSEIIKYFNNLGVYIAKEGHYLKYIKK